MTDKTDEGSSRKGAALFYSIASLYCKKHSCKAQNVRGTFVLCRPEWNGERIRANMKYVAGATALGVRVPQEELYMI